MKNLCMLIAMIILISFSLAGQTRKRLQIKQTPKQLVIEPSLLNFDKLFDIRWYLKNKDKPPSSEMIKNFQEFQAAQKAGAFVFILPDDLKLYSNPEVYHKVGMVKGFACSGDKKYEELTIRFENEKKIDEYYRIYYDPEEKMIKMDTKSKIDVTHINFKDPVHKIEMNMGEFMQEVTNSMNNTILKDSGFFFGKFCLSLTFEHAGIKKGLEYTQSWLIKHPPPSFPPVPPKK